MIYKIPRLASDIISALLAILFVYAAVSKLLDYQKFFVELRKSIILNPFAEWITWILPIFELLISILLAFKQARLLALYASFGLMVVFTCYIAVVLNLSDNIPCSCGGVLQNLSWKGHLIFNVFFLLLAMLGVLLHTTAGDSCNQMDLQSSQTH